MTSNSFRENINKLEKIIERYRYLEIVQYMIDLDSDYGIPEKGHEYREKLSGFATGEIAKVFKSEKTVKLAKYFLSIDERRVKNQTDLALIEHLKHKYRYCALPSMKTQMRMAELQSKGLVLWKEAYAKSDFNIVVEVLEEMFEIKKQYALEIDEEAHPLETLINYHEVDISLEKLTDQVEILKYEIIKIFNNEICSKNNDSINRFCNLKIDEEKLEEFCTNITNSILEENAKKVKYNKTLHPYCISLGPYDARIHSNYRSFFLGLYGLLHEMGHALYGISTEEKIAALGLWGGIEGSFDEGQSRFYENIIGKNRGFCKYIVSEAKKVFPEFNNIDDQEFYDEVNRINPGLSRLDSDELTYNLHIIIRFELEKEYFDGELRVDELPEAWNKKYKKYMGITPQNDREGILQDMHWFGGYIGYFQNYLLGNLYGGQLFMKLRKDICNLDEQLSKGDFKQLNEWQYRNIHKYGRLYSKEQIMTKTTGEPLRVDGFVQYLKDKYMK